MRYDLERTREERELTSLCREGVLVVKQSLDPCEDVVDVGWCGQSDLTFVGVDPGEVEAGERRRRREGARV